MYSDLLPIGLWSKAPMIRRIIVGLSILLVIGFTARGIGKTFSNLPANNFAPIDSANQSPLSADANDTDNGTVLPSLLIPETVEPAVHAHKIWMEVTAYCACEKCCGPNAIGVTASGKHITYNNGKFVAADTRVLPFGTKLFIPGYDNKPVEVVDRGGAIKGNKLDVFYASHQDALKWGRQKMQVVIYE